jgi:predicted nucleic acid-binding protein
MTGSTLDTIASGSRVFLDATIFIHHFTGQSLQCRRLLERCEEGEVGGVTCTAAIAEVTHRLMMIEAVSRRMIEGGNVARKLRERPDVVRRLQMYQTQIDRIPVMGIDILPVDAQVIAASAEFRRLYGLLTNDSIIAACAASASIRILASADRDFAAIDGFVVHHPGDLPVRESAK